MLVRAFARELGVQLLHENAYKLLGSTEKQTVRFLAFRRVSSRGV